MKIIYENCGVKNYIKEDYLNYIDATSATAKKKSLKKFSLVRDSNTSPPPTIPVQRPTK